jgi:DNA-binding response OmpR family regulator
VAVTRKELGEMLLEADLISPSQLTEALGLQKAYGERLASVLVRKRILTEKFAVTYLGRQVGFPGVDLSQTEIDLSALDLIPLVFCERHRVFPIRKDGDRLLLAMIDPTDAALLARIQAQAKIELAPMVALESSIRNAIREARQAQRAGRRTITPSIQDAGEEPAPPATPSAAVRPTASPTEFGAGSAIARETWAASPAQTSTDHAETPHAGEDAAVVAPTREAPLTILVAGAATEERAALDALLAEQQHRVITAAAGKDALSLVRERAPDLVMLDSMLPGIDGFEVCRQLKQDDRLRHVPVVLLVSAGLGWRFAADARERYGADDVVERPFDDADLMRRIGLLIDRTSPGLPPQTEAAVRQHLRDGVIALKQDRYDDAVTALDRGLEVDPFNDLVHYYLGMAYEKKEHPFLAIDHYEKAVQVNPEFYDAIISLADLYQRQQFRRKALEMWELALQATREDAVRERIKAHILALL